MVKELSGSASSIQEQITEPSGNDLVADISRAQAELGYAPCISLQDGLEQYLRWMRDGAQ